MHRGAGRLLPLVLLFQVLIWGAAAQQPNPPPHLNLGDAVVSGFSGTIPPDPGKPRPPNKSAADLTFINPDGPAARVVALGRPSHAWDGRLLQAPKIFDVAARDVGQVFGVALDDSADPNIYLAATSIYGLNLVDRDRDGLPERRKVGGPGAGWMKGQFGLDLQGDPGSIYRVDGKTGVVTLFAKVMLAGVPNPGPGLGNLAYDPAHKQLFATDLHTGMIQRYAIADGRELGAPYDHGVTGRRAVLLPPVPFDPAKRPNIASSRFDSENPDSWGFAPPERRVWGIAVHDGRLFYSAMNGSAAQAPEIWSVGIAQDGGLGADPQLELQLPEQTGAYSVSDVAFDRSGAIIVAQRAPIIASYDYSAFTKPGEPRVLRYGRKDSRDPPSPGLWKPLPEEYAIGWAGAYRNTDGGVALGYGYAPNGTLDVNACGASLWSTGQDLRNDPARRSQLEPGGPLLVNGLQGNPEDLVRSANEPPATSYFIDYDDKFDNARESGHIGSVRILARPCGERVAQSSPPPVVVTPVAPVGCVGPDCRNACTPTCVCPSGTTLEGKECVKTRDCPPGTVFRNGECVRVQTLLTCTPPLVSNADGTCGCPQGTVLQGRQCVRTTQACAAPLVPGPCTCPEGSVQDGGFCVSGKPIDLGIGKTGGTTPFCPAPNYAFTLTVTNVGNGFPGTNTIVVTDVVPNGMRFDTVTATGWTCNPLPANAGTTMTCTYTGPAPTAGQVLPPITVNVTALGSAPFPPYTNCASVGTTVGSGYVDGNAANNNACVTVSKPGSCACPAPQVMNADGSCGCPGGTVLVNGACVKTPVCTAPQVLGADGTCVCPAPMSPGPVLGSCLCPQGTVLDGATCVKGPPLCTSPQVPSSNGTCICPPPMLPGAVPGSCNCPPNSTLQNGKCVPVTERCKPPLVMNAAGKCVRPDVPPNRGRSKQKQGKDQDEPRAGPGVLEPGRPAGIGIPGIGMPGLGGGHGGGERGGGEKPGR